MARRLTGPVAEAPDVDLRRTTRARHQAKPGVPSCSWVKRDSAASYINCSRGESYYEKTVPFPGLSFHREKNTEVRRSASFVRWPLTRAMPPVAAEPPDTEVPDGTPFMSYEWRVA